MGFKCGIVGLPNVGKSTLFNALTNTAQAAAANYPFCTIEPNVGQVPVPDPRLNKIAEIATSKQVIPTQLSFVDIAGLVRGASKGEGLGNQFLGNIREVDAIIHVLRCFEDDDITHVEGVIDPIADAETVETELMLSDMESLEKRKSGLERRIRGQDKEAKKIMEMVERVLKVLEDGLPARKTEVADEEEAKLLKELQLITTKSVLYVCNVSEDDAADGNELSARVAEKAANEAAECVVISAALEAEIAQLDDEEEQKAFLEDLGLGETGLGRVIRAGYDLLQLITYFTAGPNEARAWTITQDTKAPQAAGVIHTDFETGFIRAETIAYDDYIEHNGENGAKDNGKMRLEGKEYIVQDGDVLLFRFAN
ncbi:redox-regulated ATPase YchF [Pseudemcibacter aquimaris]|uniref:redox-regulated ATPase YchF n=1 Tax=Pseudemcibacter aquimaris TaxID=2857064 RepID=UPI0020115B36|nr:redox-regulated ATPase YchF [Pseudemcibacter aquimaris]MCC3860999.1 redox-regulated ATPase YchF [Pseudemcibacter aquimaris]WDU59817.1 redox-regulated ATPase YchF [Pseudemcibacter aquimaris]